MNGTTPLAVERDRGREASSGWSLTLGALGVALGGIVLLYLDSFWSMVSIWTRSETFAHGYFILPISLYVAWSERKSILETTPRATFGPLVLLVPLGMGWLAARLGNVLVAEQYFAVSMLIVTLWAVLGHASARRLAFPLGFLLLAVPVGEALLPYLIDATTAFTVSALRLCGVAVLQKGNELTLSNGVWSVVEACSGLRYLIACVTIGLPFAYLTYSSWKRRAVFVAASFAVPIVANWVRAFMIVLIGYLSDMRLAVGIDHVIYGWVFYAFVMFLLLWVGSRYADPVPAEVPEAADPQRAETGGTRRTLVVGVVALLLASVWPAWASWAASGDALVVSGFELPQEIGPWVSAGSLLPLEPKYVGAGSVTSRVYERAPETVALHLALYPTQRQGAELVSSDSTVIAPGDRIWKELKRGGFDQGAVSVDERLAASDSSRLLIWHWYWVSGERTSSPVWAKIVESRQKLLGRTAPAAGVTVYTATGQDVAEARLRLSEFVDALLPELDRRLGEAFE